MDGGEIGTSKTNRQGRWRNDALDLYLRSFDIPYDDCYYPAFSRCVGIVAMWTFQVLENVGMCIGIMPITGIPLPFISFGSSSMLAQITAVGVVQSIWRNRTKSA